MLNLHTKSYVQGIFKGVLRHFLHFVGCTEARLIVFVSIKVSAILLHADIWRAGHLRHNYRLLSSLCRLFLPPFRYRQVVFSLDLRDTFYHRFFDNMGHAVLYIYGRFIYNNKIKE